MWFTSFHNSIYYRQNAVPPAFSPAHYIPGLDCYVAHMRPKMRSYTAILLVGVLVALLIRSGCATGNEDLASSAQRRPIWQPDHRQPGESSSILYPEVIARFGNRQSDVGTLDRRIPPFTKSSATRLASINHPSPANPLPSEEEFSNALARGVSSTPPAVQTSPRLSQGILPSPPQLDPRFPLWRPISSGTLPGTESREYVVPRFTLPDGRIYGPFHIGGHKFQAKPYPLDIPYLKRSYGFNQDRLYPINFEQLTQDVRVEAKGAIFRPEPHVLARISVQLRTFLRRHGWVPQLVNVHDPLSAVQGEFLWPPLKPHESKWELQMSKSLRISMYFEAMPARTQGKSSLQQAYTLTLPAGPGYDLRYIMMTPVRRPDLYTDLPYLALQDDFWLMHETLLDGSQMSKPRLALLGGMFLPRGAAEVLQRYGAIRPALTNIVRH